MAAFNTSTRYVEIYVDSRDSDQPLTPYNTLTYTTGTNNATQASGRFPFTNNTLSSSNAGLRGSTDSVVFNFQRMFGDTIGFRLVDAQIPFSYYVISQALGNSTLSITYGQTVASPVTTNATVQVPDGNYTADEFCTALNAAIAAQASISTYGTCTFSYGTTGNQLGRLLMNITTTDRSGVGATAFFTVNWASSPNLAAICGFNATNISNATNNTNITFIATYNCNFGGEDYLYIRSNLGVLLSEGVTATQSSVPVSDIIAKIPVSVNRNEIIQWTNPAREFFSIAATRLNRMTFWITTKNSIDPLQLNGQPFALKIGLLNVLSNTISVVNAGQSKYISSNPMY
jgi:hypothetical protein